MTPAARVAFRVDAGEKIGLGHLRRCLTLADRLRDIGCKVCLVCGNRLEPPVSALAAAHAVCVLEPASDDELRDAEATLSVIGEGKSGSSWVIVDSYRLGHRWERKIRDAGHRVMAIDDFRSRMHHADLLVSDSETPFDPSLNGRVAQARTLVGRKYSLIGPEYAYSPPPHPRRTGPRQLLISYGGSDPTGETLKAVAAVASLRKGAAARGLMGQVDVVIGPLNPAADAIARAAEPIRDTVVHRAPPSLAQLMRAADLCLTAGGNSMAEALALRKPCLVTVTSDNQALMANQLAAEGLIRLLGVDSALGDTIAGTLADLEAFAARVAARPVFDHLGSQRIAEAMLQGSG